MFLSESIKLYKENFSDIEPEKKEQVLKGSVLEKNLMFLLNRMKKLNHEVNDREIIKRLWVFMQNTDIDLNSSQINEIKRHGYILNEKKIPEAIFPFYRHYQYMVKRDHKYQHKSA